MSQEFLRNLILWNSISYHIQLWRFLRLQGMIKSIFNPYIILPHCVYFSSFLCIITTSIVDSYEVLTWLEPKTAESLLPRWGSSFLHLYKSSKTSEASLKKRTELMFFLRNIFFICLSSSDFQYFQKFYFPQISRM